jgi:hypothetical protein
VAVLILSGASAWAGVGGKVLLTDAPSRVMPGNLVLGTITGGQTNFQTLVEGQIIDARFSPDGKQVVYGLDGTIKVMNLETRKSKDIETYSTNNLTYFNWGTDNRIYWSDGKEMREIFSVDLGTREKKMVHKGNAGRSTVSLDGKRAAWVMPPVCSFIGGKTFRFMGGCGGAVSPSGKYLTSNLTTSHNLIGIFTFGDEGPSEKPVAYVAALNNYAINGFFFGRSDDWVCYTVEAPTAVSPIAFINYWRTDDHIEIAKKHCIKDFFDESDVVPANAELQAITVCAEGPVNLPLSNICVNVGVARPVKVVGHYTAGSGRYTPQLREGVIWKSDAARVAMTSSSCRGVSESGPVTVTAAYQGKTFSLDVTVLPPLTGDGFKAEYFSDYAYSNKVVTRVEPYVDFRWEGGRSPDPSINKGRAPWSARWTGMLDVQTDGDYVFSFLQGEGNDRWVKEPDGGKRSGWCVWVDDQIVVTLTKNWNHPWSKPKASLPIALKKGQHAVKVTTVGDTAQPVVAQLFWSGPGIRQSLLGGGYVHANATAEELRAGGPAGAPAPGR